MLPTNILYRTFFIRAEQYGTAFALEFGGKQYLVTAKHLLHPYASSFNLQVFYNKQWLSGRAEVVGRARGEIDIALLRVAQQLTPPAYEVAVGFGEIELGQDVYFLGYPFKMWVDYGELTVGLPSPFIKKGTLSAVQINEPKLLYIDAINNEGFSGGPLYFFPRARPQEVRIAGVVSKYKTEQEAVLDSEGQATDMVVPYNTGFMVVYDIKYAIALAEAQAGV